MLLNETYESDLYRQFTQYGIHNADIIINSADANLKAKSFFSRGQQKILLFALKFAQTNLLNKSCVFLIDDLSAELDRFHLEKIMNYIKNSGNQFFITAQPDEDYSQYLNTEQVQEILL